MAIADLDDRHGDTTKMMLTPAPSPDRRGKDLTWGWVYNKRKQFFLF